MKKILIVALVIASSLIGAISASADTTVTITDDYSGLPTFAGAYVGPVPTTLNSPTPTPIPGGMACVDMANKSYFGSTIGVVIHTLQPLNMTGARFGSDDAAIFEYEEAAWLLGQIPSHSNEVGPIQFAMWKVFEPDYVNNYLASHDPGAITAVNQWLALANNINPNDYDFSSVSIYTPTAAYASNQEFISGVAVHTPLPPSALLLGSGLLGLGLLGSRRRRLEG